MVLNGSTSTVKEECNEFCPGISTLQILINDLDERMEGMLIKCIYDTKAGGWIGNTPRNRHNIQLDLDRLKHWVVSNKILLNGGKSKSLHFGRKNFGTNTWKAIPGLQVVFERSSNIGRPQVKHESALCHSYKKNQCSSDLYQQIVGSDSTTGQTTPGILSPVLVTTIPKGCWRTGKRAEKIGKND